MKTSKQIVPSILLSSETTTVTTAASTTTSTMTASSTTTTKSRTMTKLADIQKPDEVETSTISLFDLQGTIL